MYGKLLRSKYDENFDPKHYLDDVAFNRAWFNINEDKNLSKIEFFYGPYLSDD